MAGTSPIPKAIESAGSRTTSIAPALRRCRAPVFSVEELFKAAGGKDKLDAYLAVSASVADGGVGGAGHRGGVRPVPRDDRRRSSRGWRQVVAYLRKTGGKPVMVGHGGYWNRLEFEKVPFFDIYDPETEPLYPANLHTDLAPLVQGKDKVIWLRPQMYEDRALRALALPRLRRADARLPRLADRPRAGRCLAVPRPARRDGVHEADRRLDRCRPGSRHRALDRALVAAPPGQALRDRGHDARHRPGPLDSGRGRRARAGKVCRVTQDNDEVRDEANAYGIGGDAERGPSIHGIQYLPDARAWPKGSKIVQWVRLDGKASPRKPGGAGQGRRPLDARGRLGQVRSRSPSARTRRLAYWFLNSFYRHAKGFLGWDTRLVEKRFRLSLIELSTGVPCRRREGG